MRKTLWAAVIVTMISGTNEKTYSLTPLAIMELDAAPTADGRLRSNSIIDIIPHGNIVWLGTGNGISKWYLDGSGVANIQTKDGIGQGGSSALAVTDSIIWAATGFYEKTSVGYLPAGGGVGFSRDDGNSWTWLPQPVDPRTITHYKPTTTHIQNVTYDIALTDSAVWIVSWGGGIRRMGYGDTSFVVQSPNGKPFSALDNLSHLGFSAVWANRTLFVGTAEGIFRTSDEGESWEQSKFEAAAPSISGNFITALAAQFTGEGYNIWAATWKAQGALEYYGVAVSRDNGLSWRTVLSDSTFFVGRGYLVDLYGNLRVHNFGFSGNDVWAAADGGLWHSPDDGMTWGDPIMLIEDRTIGERLENVDFFSVALVGDSVWVGTDDGLAVGWFDPAVNGYTWRIHRAFVSPGQTGEPETYAYPSPFSPLRGHTTRFQFPLNNPAGITVGIWNFAMEPVITLGPFALPGGGTGNRAGYAAVKWDGRDRFGRMVANGVYFYRITTEGREMWGKVMVLN